MSQQVRPTNQRLGQFRIRSERPYPFKQGNTSLLLRCSTVLAKNEMNAIDDTVLYTHPVKMRAPALVCVSPPVNEPPQLSPPQGRPLKVHLMLVDRVLRIAHAQSKPRLRSPCLSARVKKTYNRPANSNDTPVVVPQPTVITQFCPSLKASELFAGDHVYHWQTVIAAFPAQTIPLPWEVMPQARLAYYTQVQSVVCSFCPRYNLHRTHC